jgi:hypothetical protein
MAYYNDRYTGVGVEEYEENTNPRARIDEQEYIILNNYTKVKNKKTNLKKYHNNLSKFAKTVLAGKYTEVDGQEITVAEKVIMGAIANLIANPNMKDLRELQKLVGEDGASDVSVTVSVESLLKKVEGSEF